MRLPVKRPDHIVPSYSLTGDIISFERCALQYRYYNGSSLPPSRPVQLWFGEFVHGVLESAYRLWSVADPKPAFPWPCNVPEWRVEPGGDVERNDIGVLGYPIEEALRQQGKQARSTRARESAYQRVEGTINSIGAHLFPLIESAEQTVVGTRQIPGDTTQLRATRYEIHGKIDVVSYLKLAEVDVNNPLRQAILTILRDPPTEFEVIIDYKGQRRPRFSDPGGYLAKYEQQIQTYAWLRNRVAGTLPVVAGMLIYVNELSPNRSDLLALQRAISNRTEDVAPEPGTQDYLNILNWRPGQNTNFLSLEYRLRRAIQVVDVSAASIQAATMRFDTVVREMEERVAAEPEVANLQQTWAPTCQDNRTCVACDFRYSCPRPANQRDDDLDDEEADDV